MKKYLILLAPILLLAPFVAAQTLVQQSPSHLDAATQVTTNVATGTTSTLTPNGGELVYIYEIDIENCAGTAVTSAAPTSITTTNLAGSAAGGWTPTFSIASGTTTGTCAQMFSMVYPTGLKSRTPGNAVTFVMPSFVTNQTVRLNVAWRSGPVQ